MYAGIDFGTSNSTVVGVSEQGLVETFDIDHGHDAAVGASKLLTQLLQTDRHGVPRSLN